MERWKLELDELWGICVFRLMGMGWDAGGDGIGKGWRGRGMGWEGLEEEKEEEEEGEIVHITYRISSKERARGSVGRAT